MFLWLEESFRWVQESDSVFTYPAFITLHTFGLTFLVGPSVAIALRILGVARALPLPPLARLYPIMMIGFWLNVVTGALLFAPEATRWASNPDFILKIGFVVLGAVLVRQTRRSVFGSPDPGMRSITTGQRLLAVSTMVAWVGAIFTGRMTAYVDSWVAFANLFKVG